MDKHHTHDRCVCVFIAMWVFLSGNFRRLYFQKVLISHSRHANVLQSQYHNNAIKFASASLMFTWGDLHTCSLAKTLHSCGRSQTPIHIPMHLNYSPCAPRLSLSLQLSLCSVVAFSFLSVHLQPLHPLPCSFPPSLMFVLRLMTLSVWYKAV